MNSQYSDNEDVRPLYDINDDELICIQSELDANTSGMFNFQF